LSIFVVTSTRAVLDRETLHAAMRRKLRQVPRRLLGSAHVPYIRRFLPCRVVLAMSFAVLANASRAAADPSTTTPEQGFDLGEIQSPRTIAMGGAQTALGTSTSALYLNPANLPYARVYHFEGLASISPEARRQSYGGAVVDSVTSRVAGGIAGAWSQQDPDGINRQWTDLRLGLALPLGERFSLGVTGRYLRLNQAPGRGPLGASLASGGAAGEPAVNTLTMDIGATIAVGDAVRIALLGRNLTNPGSSFAPTSLIGALGYQAGIIAFELDGMADFTSWGKPKARLMLGGEVFLAKHYPLRLGYRYDDGQTAHAVSAGFGYVDTKFSVELSARRDFPTDFPSTVVSLGLRYFYDAAKATPDEPDNF
jgi:hypothetical protein